MNPWSKLPNAKYIDAVIASVKANPKKWARARARAKAGGWGKTRIAARDAAYNSAREVIYDTARSAEWNAAWIETRIVARDAILSVVRDVILALVAYDDCAHLLTTNPEHVKMMAELGDEVAILLYPASLVFSEIKNECLV